MSTANVIPILPEQAPPKYRGNKTPVVIDLCCGLGGLSCAARSLGMEVIAGVDTDKNALKTFKNNFPGAQPIQLSVRSKSALAHCQLLAKAHSINGRPLIVVSGPPCQGFSAAGSRNPKDRRNKILLGVGRAIAVLKPAVAIVENVPMLLASKYDERVETFKRILTVSGYKINQVTLNAENFGVPQKRRRAFFLLTKSSVAHRLIADLLEANQKPTITAAQAIGDLPVPKPRPEKYWDEFDSEHYSNHFMMRHSHDVQKKIARILPGTGPMSYRRLHPDQPSNTLFSGHRAPPAHYSQPRSITVREAARLQGFPDSFRIFGPFANQMAQVTNAVPPPLARAVLSVASRITGLIKQ